MTKKLLQWIITISAFAITMFNLLAMTAYAKDAGDLSSAKPPVSPIRPVTNTYFGVTVTDPYQWLENIKDPEAEKWLEAENNYTRLLLDQIPKRKALLQRISALGDASEQVGGTQWAEGFYFYLKRRHGDNNRKLYVRQGINGKERLLVDPDRLSDESQHAAIDYYRPSWDGKYVAYGISRGGSENSILHIVETATGQQLPDQIERADFGSPSWILEMRRRVLNDFYLEFYKPTSAWNQIDPQLLRQYETFWVNPFTKSAMTEGTALGSLQLLSAEQLNQHLQSPGLHEVNESMKFPYFQYVATTTNQGSEEN